MEQKLDRIAELISIRSRELQSVSLTVWIAALLGLACLWGAMAAFAFF
jgi:hypothetical protein